MPNPILGLPRQIDQLPDANLPLAGDEILVVLQDSTMRQVDVDALLWRSIGATADRPTLTSDYAGWQHYDTTLSLPVWWTGSAWKNAAGVVA